MRKVNDYEITEPNLGGSFEKLEAGGYVCRITRVEDVPEKEYLKIEFDITDGPRKNWFADIHARAGFWGGKMIRSYKDSAVGFFKGFMTSVENSNPGYKWAWSEHSLEGKYVGLVLAYEEYTGNDGSIKERIYVAQNRSVDAIKKGDFTVPALKKLSQAARPAARNPREPGEEMQEIDENMPF